MKDADFFEPSEILYGQIQCSESQPFSLVVMFNLTSFWVRDNSISLSYHRNLVNIRITNYSLSCLQRQLYAGRFLVAGYCCGAFCT